MSKSSTPSSLIRMAAKELWTEKYRPKTLDGYVFQNESQKDQIKRMIVDGDIPHLLLSGTQGSGKTTLAEILINELGVDDFDI
jgi:replication-associated recombination protein RarA